jgi:hypothetical protein
VEGVEICTGLEYFKEVHLKSEALREDKERVGNEVRVGFKYALFKIVVRFLGRGSKRSREGLGRLLTVVFGGYHANLNGEIQIHK